MVCIQILFLKVYDSILTHGDFLQDIHLERVCSNYLETIKQFFRVLIKMCDLPGKSQ